MTITYIILKHVQKSIAFLTKDNPLIMGKVNQTHTYIREKGFIRYFSDFAKALCSNIIKPKYEADLGITVIVKNEAPYIKEWIEFHKLAGVGKFFIYDNDSTDNLKEVLQPYIDLKEVVYTYFPGKKQQFPAYQHSITHNRHKVRYMAIIDADEFIQPIKHKTIIEFINYLENKIGHKIDALGINWLLHGFNAHYTKPEGLVCENFRKYDYNTDANRHIKSIVNPRSVIAVRHPHFCIHLPGAKIVNSRGMDMYEAFTGPYLDEIRINHYWTKSFEEYQARISKGKADGNTPVELSYNPEFISVDDDPSIDGYIEILKEKLNV